MGGSRAEQRSQQDVSCSHGKDEKSEGLEGVVCLSDRLGAWVRGNVGPEVQSEGIGVRDSDSARGGGHAPPTAATGHGRGATWGWRGTTAVDCGLLGLGKR